MAVRSQARVTAAEYRAFEMAAEYKNEFVDGEIFAMAGASREHNLIGTNLTREISAQLRGRSCETYPGEMRVKVIDPETYAYPDVVVVCGEPEFEEAELDSLLNPTLIIEILSPSTEAWDRGGKFARYARLASLQEYLLVAQDRPRIERFRRAGGEEWIFSATEGLDATLALPSIDCYLSLADVYERIRFGGESAADPSEGAARD